MKNRLKEYSKKDTIEFLSKLDDKALESTFKYLGYDLREIQRLLNVYIKGFNEVINMYDKLMLSYDYSDVFQEVNNILEKNCIYAEKRDLL